MDGQAFRLERNQATSQEIYDPGADGSTAADAPVVPAVPSAMDIAILSILSEPRRPGVLTSDAFRAKEHALGALFATLTAAEALALHRRFVAAGADDTLAAAFARLVIDRRQRLLGFLTEVRRRASGGG